MQVRVLPSAPKLLAVRNSYCRSDVVLVPLVHLAVADRHVRALTMLACRDDALVSSLGRASVGADLWFYLACPVSPYP